MSDLRKYEWRDRPLDFVPGRNDRAGGPKAPGWKVKRSAHWRGSDGSQLVAVGITTAASAGS
jgi:hypothetical protein